MSQSNTPGNHLVFQYSKRRFDGGTEREIIAHIERQIQVRHHEGMGMPRSVLSAMPIAQPVATASVPPAPAVQATPVQDPTPTVKSLLFQASILPVIELVLGLSGIVVTSVMMVSMKPNENLLADRKKLREQSHIAIKKSLKNIALAPYNLLKACV